MLTCVLPGVVYASVVSEDASAKVRLETAVSTFLVSVDAKDSVLWSMSFRASGPAVDALSGYPALQKHSSHILLFPPKPHDIAFDDTMLDAVKQAWEVCIGVETAAESSFLRFEERESEVED